ncbi:hypothetical protein L0F81_22285 [Streptomyces tricolor]|uniref:Uncharacterized protein n=1 Tax=Streptomyces tricolor TaxID=68277 RepID=A0ABS9JK94_9ACTN|nr:hypothetical protein [Streptomyces tricolor]MCG0065991.1 hypothetical protein [Streptomyces tricolor]
MHSFRMVLIPQCGQCGTAVTDDAGRDLLVPARLLDGALRRRLAAEGWEVIPGTPRVNRGPADTVGGDRLTCPACAGRREQAADAERRRLAADHARPRVKTVDLSAKLGEGWTLTQRAGDAERHCWLVERDGAVRGRVRRYRRAGGGFSTGWEAHALQDIYWFRQEAVACAQHRPNSSYLWSGRDLAAWGVATNPPYGADRPEWATRTRKDTA